MSTSQVIQRKIKTYHDFIEDKLKEDLKQAQAALERFQQEKQDWMDAKLNLKMLRIFREKCSKQDLTMDVPFAEWGNKAIIASATVTNLDHVYINIGCDVRLRMELDEADKYADIRIRAVERQLKHFMDIVVQVNVHIKVTLLAINELIESEKLAKQRSE